MHKGRGAGECNTPFCSHFWLSKTQDSSTLLSGELETKSGDIRLRILSINPLDLDLLRSPEGPGCYHQKQHARPHTHRRQKSSIPGQEGRSGFRSETEQASQYSKCPVRGGGGWVGQLLTTTQAEPEPSPRLARHTKQLCSAHHPAHCHQPHKHIPSTLPINGYWHIWNALPIIIIIIIINQTKPSLFPSNPSSSLLTTFQSRAPEGLGGFCNNFSIGRAVLSGWSQIHLPRGFCSAPVKCRSIRDRR